MACGQPKLVMEQGQKFEPPGRASLLIASRFKQLYLSYFSKPRSDRVIYRTIARRKVRRIVEIGIGTGQRALRMIDLASRCGRGEMVRYAAIDLFESRPPEASRGLSLIEAHRLLQSTAAKIQLIPGDPASALARWANSLQNVDLVVIAADHDEQALAGAWFYLPRMLHAGSTVYLESRAVDSQMALRVAPRREIDQRAAAGRRRAA
jgi:hypothetical protein